jgi:type II secretory pathway component PulK
MMRRRRSGFVLMAALWLLVALSAVGLDAALRHRARRMATANLVDTTRLHAAASAGTEYARSRLSSAMLGRADELRAEATRAARTQNRGGPVNAAGRALASAGGGAGGMTRLFRSADPGADPWRDPSGLVPTQLEWNGVTTTLTLRDPNAALNINGANADMLQQFFSLGLRLDYALANRLTAAIMDWRDDDDLPQVNGGERDDYIKDGAAVLPANHQFSNIDELRFVKGMTDEIFSAARPFLCIRTNGTTLNVNAAPEEVLLAIPGMTPEGATSILRQRRAGVYPRNTQELLSILPGSTAKFVQQMGARGLLFSTDQVQVIAETSIPGSPVHATAEIVVERALNGATVSWRRVQ